MVEVHRSNLPPTVRWISHQIFLRTIWTKVKQSRRGGDDRCSNCGLYPERTTHVFFSCRAATNLYNQLRIHINTYIQEYALEEPITIDLDTRYRSRFITQNIPSTRFLILNMVLTLAKTIKLEKEQLMLHHILQQMKRMINLD